MLNKQSILNAISRYVNPQKAQSLSEAFDVANNLLNAANNPEEVFQKERLRPSGGGMVCCYEHVLL